MARPSLLLSAALAALALPARAATLSAINIADLKRAFAAAALSTREEPAVRAERAHREPSAGFMIGAALGAWIAARDQLGYDLKNPQAAGPPHASQGPTDLDAIGQDCSDEQLAFTRLETRSHALGLEPAEVLKAAAVPDPALPDAWRMRRDHAPACTPD